MARYSVAFQKSGITTAGAVVDLAASSTDRPRLVELGLFISSVAGVTPALTLGLFRTTAIGTRTSPTTVLAEEIADLTGTASITTAWSVAPTLATTPVRRFVANAIGAGVIWTFPGLTIGASGSLVLNAITVAGNGATFTVDGYVVVDE